MIPSSSRWLTCAALVALVPTWLLDSRAAQAEEITVAAAADLRFAMDEIAESYRREYPGDGISVQYGSSGRFFTQIQQGAPLDLYFSADIEFPRKLAAGGFAASDVRPYAFGRIVLWSATFDAARMTLASLADAKITRVAIANPKHAPYGKRAEEALRAAGLWGAVQPKLVFGENIAQAAQFVQTGNAQAGIIALSLALSPEMTRHGGYWLIPENLHQPLAQGFVITKRAANNRVAWRFAEYMQSAAARTMMEKYGFTLPAKRDGG